MFPSLESAEEMFVPDDSCPAYAAVLNHYWQLSESERRSLRRKLRNSSDVRTAPLPMVLRRDVFDWSRAAAKEHATAISRFLRDVYREKHPIVLRKIPQLRTLLYASPYFVRTLVGRDALQELPWNFEMAMDWSVCRGPSGALLPFLMENDTCAIGGLITLALSHNNFRAHWPNHTFDPFLDNRRYLHRLLDHAKESSKGFGPGKPLIFVEKCLESILKDGRNNWLRSELIRHGFVIAGPWNKHLLKFDRHLQKYFFNRNPISLIMLYYYPFCFDREFLHYKQVSKIYKNSYEYSHAMDGHWSRFFNGGFRRWAQTNPLGSDLFADKAIVAFLPDIVRFYLHREPALPEKTYTTFVEDNGRVSKQRVQMVFDDRARWVVKSRLDSGMGLGVFVGRDMHDGEVMNKLTWETLRRRVLRDPIAYVAQRLVEDVAIRLPTGRRMSFEMRNIVHIFGKAIVHVDPLLMRVAPPGEQRSISVNPKCQRVHVLTLPRRMTS